MSEEIKTVELAPEPEVAAVKTPEIVTIADLKTKGWSGKEIDEAKKRGMIEEGEVVKPVAKKEEPPIIEKPKVEPERRADSSLPEFTFKTPEQEKAFMDAFGPGTEQRAMYFRMKNERQSRQRAESERDRMALELQMLKDQKLNIDNKPSVEVDADGNVIDPEDKPLTLKQLREMQKTEQEAINKQQEELNSRSSKVADAMKTQEEYAKTLYPDFDDTVKLATDLVNHIEQVPETWKRNKIAKLLKDLQVTAATADKYGVDDYTASMIAYELGQLHPLHGKKTDPDGTPKPDPKANGSLTPEQMKRIEENTQRRNSSASLPGSSNGRRVISVSDITIKDILKMSPDERYKFKKDHPDKMAQLMRG
jgi:hypothetical protein